MFHTPLEMRRNNNECVYRFLKTNGSLAPFPLLEHLTRNLSNVSPYQPMLIRKILLQRCKVAFLEYPEFLRGQGMCWPTTIELQEVDGQWSLGSFEHLCGGWLKKLQDYNNCSGSSCMTPIHQQWPLKTFFRTLRCGGNTTHRDYKDFFLNRGQSIFSNTYSWKFWWKRK